MDSGEAVPLSRPVAARLAVDAASSLDLLARAQAGDQAAMDALMARYLPRLRRWASGRLPARARGMADTEDLVQDALLQTLKRIDGFEPRHEGALQAYLRQAVMNRLRDHLRSAARRPPGEDADIPGNGASPLEVTIGEHAVGTIVSTYSDAHRGTVCALFGSSDHLEVAVNGGSAAQALQLGRGARIVISRSDRSDRSC